MLLAPGGFQDHKSSHFPRACLHSRHSPHVLSNVHNNPQAGDDLRTDKEIEAEISQMTCLRSQDWVGLGFEIREAFREPKRPSVLVGGG